MPKKRKQRKPRSSKAEAVGPNDPLLSGRFTVTINSLVGNVAGRYSSSEYTLINLVTLLREMHKHRDLALRIIWSNFLVIRKEFTDGIDGAKDIIIEKIAAHWGVAVTRKQLEPKIIEWHDLEDLVLPYNANKLPVIRKKHEVREATPSLEEQIAKGDFNVE